MTNLTFKQEDMRGIAVLRLNCTGNMLKTKLLLYCLFVEWLKCCIDQSEAKAGTFQF